MRKKGWLSAVKKAFSPESKEKKSQKLSKSNKKWFGKEKLEAPSAQPSETVPLPLHIPPPPPPLEEVKLGGSEEEEVGDDQTKRAYVAIATAAAAEAAAAAAQAAAEVVRLTSVTPFAGMSRDEVAAIKIQTAFRGYMARRALRALRGLVRLKTLIDGPIVKRQTASGLRCMQNVGRVQSQIQTRRIRMSEENQAFQRQLLQKRAKELASLKVGEEWDISLQSKEQIEASLLSKFEATMRRERALAYSFSHQQSWKKSARSSTIMFMDPNNPHWGWSWMERFMASRPWETQPAKEFQNDNSSLGLGGDITKSYARHILNSDKPSPPSTQKSIRKSPSTPTSSKSSAVRRKLKPSSVFSPNDDTKSMFSIASERNRRHSIASSSVRDDESLASSPSVPSYMAPTQSAKAKTRGESPLGMENGDKENLGGGFAKKRLSFPSSPARLRRHSGPPKVDVSVVSVTGSERNQRIQAI